MYKYIILRLNFVFKRSLNLNFSYIYINNIIILNL